MTENEPSHRDEHYHTRRRRRGSLFWPVLLIAVGVIFLLENLGLVTGDIWDNIFRLWPVLLIAIGLDNLWQRQGLVGAALMIGLGVIFLMANYQLLALSAWQVIFSLWPVLLIAMGFDILIGRRSTIGGIIGLVLVVAIMVGALWMIGTATLRGQSVDGQEVRQELGDASQARVVLEPGVGTLKLGAMLEPVALVMGTVPEGGGITVRQDYYVRGDTANYILSGAGGAFSFPGTASVYLWDLQLNPEVPTELEIKLGVGDANLELNRNELNALYFDMGVGQATIQLPAESVLDARVDAAIGQVIIVVPEGVGLRLQVDTAIVVVNHPDSYQVEGGVYTSPGYANADYRINLTVDMAIGRLVIRHK